MILVFTPRPSALLSGIRAAIQSRRIETWTYDQDGDFTHSPPQWRNKAWLRPHVLGGELRPGIIRPSGGVLTSEIYAIFHGRFIEMLLAHFDEAFATAHATAQFAWPDVGNVAR